MGKVSDDSLLGWKNIMSRRIRMKSLQGGLKPQRKAALKERLYENVIKFSRLSEANEVYICGCLEDDDVDLTISAKVTEELKNIGFDVIVPPRLRAKKSMIIHRRDQEITSYNVEEIKKDIEGRNIWTNIDEVVKMKNIAHMLKVRFRDIALARKAISSGLCIFLYHLSSNQVEQEEFYSITLCWSCYRYDHQARDCPDKETTVCSECAETGYSFKVS